MNNNNQQGQNHDGVVDKNNVYSNYKLKTKNPEVPKEKNLGLRYKCTAMIGDEMCIWSFHKKAHFDRHSLKHALPGVFVCPLCNASAKHKQNMPDHWRKNCRGLYEDDNTRENVLGKLSSKQVIHMVNRRMVELGRGAEQLDEGAIFVLNPQFMINCAEQINQLPETSCPCCNLSMIAVFKNFHSDVHFMKKRIDERVNNVWFCNLCSSKFQSQPALYNHWRSTCPQMVAFASSTDLSNPELACLAFNILQSSIPLEYYTQNSQLRQDRQTMITFLQSKRQTSPDGKIYVYTGKIHPIRYETVKKEHIFHECVDVQSFWNIGEQNMEFFQIRENALPMSSPWTVSNRGYWELLQSPDGYKKKIFVFGAEDTVLNSYQFSDRTRPRLNNAENQWNIQNKGEKCTCCNRVFSSKGRLIAHQSVHDEKNFCILCKTRFNSAGEIRDHFKRSCELTKRLLNSEIRKKVEQGQIYLLINAINRVNLMFADKPEKVRSIVDSLANKIVIDKSCKTNQDVGRFIEMCRNENLIPENEIEVFQTVEIASQATSQQLVQNQSRQNHPVQNAQFQSPIVQRPAMRQFDGFHRAEPKVFYKQAQAMEARLCRQQHPHQNRGTVVYRDSHSFSTRTQQMCTSSRPNGMAQQLNNSPNICTRRVVQSKPWNSKSNPNVVYRTMAHPQAVPYQHNNGKRCLVNGYAPEDIPSTSTSQELEPVSKKSRMENPETDDFPEDFIEVTIPAPLELELSLKKSLSHPTAPTVTGACIDHLPSSVAGPSQDVGGDKCGMEEKSPEKIKLSKFNKGVKPRVRKPERSDISMEVINLNPDRERSRQSFDPKMDIVEGDGLQIVVRGTL